jgi:hypothetical protein
MLRTTGLSLLIVAVLPLGAVAQNKPREVHVLYKDFFIIRGKVAEGIRDVIYDSASGKSFPIPSGKFSIDDHVRTIMFSPAQVLKVIEPESGKVKEPMKIWRIKLANQSLDLNSNWVFTKFGQWENCDRTLSVQIRTPKGESSMTMTQKIAMLSPRYLMAFTVDYKWDLRYATQEFSPETVRGMILHVFNEKKELRNVKPVDKFLQIAGFMHEAGWYKEAEEELDNITKNFPAQKKIAEELLAKVRKDRAELFVESIEQAKKVGQHEQALDRLADYEQAGHEKIVSQRHRDIANDLKLDYDRDKGRIEQARKYLKDLPKLTRKPATWEKATAFIADELNYDTVDRITEFIKSAKVHETQRQDKAPPTLSADQVLALAVTGWLQGKQGFDTDPKVAMKLLEARAFVLKYHLADNDRQRTEMLSGFKRDAALPIDVMSKLIRMIPPIEPHKTINTDVQTMNLPGGGSYLLQLPPDYHHQRAYPVVFVLHSGRENAEETLKRCSEDAAKQGFILAAPLWAGNKFFRAKYQYSSKEHGMVLEALRDLRRKFQIDSDRVFLFGSEDGAEMAYDVGLAHPDLFAGVVPMNGSMTKFAQRFLWTNAQYLPFYVIQGERSGNAAITREVFKEWTRVPFACIYAEYKGRGSEWFSAEVPLAFDWMSRKKRHTPMKEMGRANLNGGLGEEFRSSRSDDNRFYWLSAGGIGDTNTCNVTSKTWPDRYRPATFQADLSMGNRLDKATGTAKIWNQVNLRCTGVRQLTLWITPDMMDLTKPLEIRDGGRAVGGMRTITPSLDVLLDELYQTGDRQRLFVAKEEVR